MCHRRYGPMRDGGRCPVRACPYSHRVRASTAQPTLRVPCRELGQPEDIDMGILRRMANLIDRKGPAPRPLRPKCLHGDLTVGNNPALHAAYQNMDAEQRHLATTRLGAAEAAVAEM